MSVEIARFFLLCRRDSGVEDDFALLLRFLFFVGAMSTAKEALEIVLKTAEALFQDRDSRLFGSHIKQTLKRKRPEFSEAFHGYRSFNELLEDAQRRGLLELQKDEPSGGYIVVGLE